MDLSEPGSQEEECQTDSYTNTYRATTRGPLVKIANNSNVDYKLLVQQGYDRCAEAYDAVRSLEAGDELALLSGKLVKGAKVLDIGCGSGIPIARSLVQRCDVTGVDLSKEMIELAKKNIPEAHFIHADIMSIGLPDSHYDAVLAFYSIFHIPREEHGELFRRIHRWLKVGGYLLATVSKESEVPYLEEDFFGVTMYWSHYGLEDYESMLGDAGFNLLEKRFVGHGYRCGHDTPEEQHPLILAQKG
ncbi:MAG: methyltransferase domain-containing protein [Anaerolineales bacterium]|nr:methyltransferase domain-containing protein [Anaerolineales bacterium]